MSLAHLPLIGFFVGLAVGYVVPLAFGWIDRRRRRKGDFLAISYGIESINEQRARYRK